MRKFRSLLLFFNSLKEQNEISEICSSKMRFTKIRTKPEKTYQNMKPQLNMGIINNLPEKWRKPAVIYEWNGIIHLYK